MNHNNIYRKTALKKVRFSLGIVLIYILGCNLVVPGIDYQSITHTSNMMTFAMSMTGLSLNTLSLFSLGISPWMSALIIWRVLSIVKIFNIKNLTNKHSYQLRFVLSLLFGVIQSFTIISNVRIVNEDKKAIATWMLVLLLVAGFSILVWLGNLNTQYGLGGFTLIILVNIIRDWPSRIFKALPASAFHPSFTVIISWILVIAIFFCVSYMIFRFYQGERRLPLMHIMLDDQFSEQSYLPISTNPAGGMAFMFAFSVTLIPQYILYLFKMFYGENRVFVHLYEQLQLDHLLGIFLYMISLALLTYGFAYVNIDYKEISENLKKSGDYFINVYPGKNTEKYLFHQISKMATISAIFNVCIIGIPFLSSLIWPSISALVYLIPTWLIFMILMTEIVIQFLRVYHRNDYKTYFRENFSN